MSPFLDYYCFISSPRLTGSKLTKAVTVEKEWGMIICNPLNRSVYERDLGESPSVLCMCRFSNPLWRKVGELNNVLLKFLCRLFQSGIGRGAEHFNGKLVYKASNLPCSLLQQS